MDTLSHSSAVRPLEALADGAPGALAIITGIEGPSYRPLGAMMAVLDGRRRVGSLSSGCVEGDIALHADEARGAAQTRAVRYGLGSPFKDIQLPCGGGLDILLLPDPDRAVLRAVLARHVARAPCTLAADAVTGALSLADGGATGWDGDRFRVRIEPEIAFLVFGKGPEAATFAALACAAGFPVTLLSPDDETLAAGLAAGCETRHLVSKRFPEDLAPDRRTAVVLFFHDHEWEPPILAAALDSPAFYIGAQGSRRARDTREAGLEALGVVAGSYARMKGPIGLVPSARDARTLAVSVLAEVLSETHANPA
ncbi:MAG: XdhC family protein [Maritimibacter sp.]|nr:XdhC family protein [Maritimibacter sp.]